MNGYKKVKTLFNFFMCVCWNLSILYIFFRIFDQKTQLCTIKIDVEILRQDDYKTNTPQPISFEPRHRRRSAQLPLTSMSPTVLGRSVWGGDGGGSDFGKLLWENEACRNIGMKRVELGGPSSRCLSTATYFFRFSGALRRTDTDFFWGAFLPQCYKISHRIWQQWNEIVTARLWDILFHKLIEL